MEASLGYRALRKIFNYIPPTWLTENNAWQWLRFYPAIIPASQCFNEWNEVESEVEKDKWQSYETWVEQNCLSSLNDWYLLQQQAFEWQSPPRISIVTPVYNTSAEILYECVLSVRAQAYPFWQLILVDDGSSNHETLNFLGSGVCKDPRIRVLYNKESQGISKASNLAIEKSHGDYVAFLDHDDRLSLDALFKIADEIRQDHKVDIIYSDRDMISEKGRLYMHLFKPDWSPETLLSGNYIFHLMCYRRSLLNQLGGYRSALDGSQDYDLILRATETKPRVKHIQTVLYHWRQYQGSVALDSSAKDYAFKAGIAALNQALQRRGIEGTASEIKTLYRGNYQLNLKQPVMQDIEIINIDLKMATDAYSIIINQAVQNTDRRKPFIALLSQALKPVNEDAITLLAAWTKMDGVGFASGGIETDDSLIEYVGATYGQQGDLLLPYQRCSIDEIGYMAITRLVRNISAPHPYCVVIRRELWQKLAGLDCAYKGYYALLDFALSALAENWRGVSVPQAKFVTKKPELLTHYPQQDRDLFFKRWQCWLEQGDPYYNVNLDRSTQQKAYHIG